MVQRQPDLSVVDWTQEKALSIVGAVSEVLHSPFGQRCADIGGSAVFGALSLAKISGRVLSTTSEVLVEMARGKSTKDLQVGSWQPVTPEYPVVRASSVDAHPGYDYRPSRGPSTHDGGPGLS